MAKGVFTIEFDNVVDLLQQLRLLTIGAALPDIKAPVVVTRTTDDTPKATESAQIGKPEPLYPVVDPEPPESAPETARGVLGKLGDGMTVKPAPETAAPQEPAKDPAGTAALQQEPPKGESPKVRVTLENLADTPYDALLSFCEQNPGVGVNVAKCGAAFFRTMVEHKVRVFLETTAG